MNLSILDYYW